MKEAEAERIKRNMLEKVWDKGEAYYKGYMLGVIIAEVESYREVVTILRAYKKKRQSNNSG